MTQRKPKKRRARTTPDEPANALPDMQADVAQLFNAANAHYRDQHWAEALAGYEQALGSSPTFEPALLQRARCLVRLGHWASAREAFATLLRSNPAHYSGWLEAGNLCRRMGQTSHALVAYRKAMDTDPKRHEAPLALGRALEEQGQFEQAEPVLAHAMQAAAHHSVDTLRESQRYLGRVRIERGDLPRALQALRAALAVARQDPREQVASHEAAELRIDVAEVLLRDGQHDKALEQLELARGSGRESTLTRLSELAFTFNHWERAIEVARENLQRHPGSAWAHWNLAHLLGECWQMDEAEALLCKAEAMAPMPGAMGMRASMANKRGDADAALALYRQLHASELASSQNSGSAKGMNYASSAAMSSLYSDKLSAAEVAAMHVELFKPLGQHARPRSSFQREPLAGRRIRLGIVSGDFHHQHPVNIFMQPVLRELDRSQFELFVYACGRSHDAQSELAKTRTEHWLQCSTWTDLQLASRIDEDRIDLLLDLAGHTAGNRMAMFGARAAPVQCTYLGYPGSTGVPNMDWMLGDEVVTPRGCDHLYAERIARLPGAVFCYAPETHYPLPSFGPEWATRPLTFGCFNNVPKLTPRTLQLWARILKRLPQARLLLKAPSFFDKGAVKLYRDRLEALGVAPEQLMFRGPSGLADMMAEYADVDIALDPVPYNGGTTTLQAMWMGVPAVVMEGQHFVSRMGASFMRASGLDDWISQDDDSYVDMAVAHASQRDKLRMLKASLRERLQALDAWNPVKHTRAMEAAFKAMV
jgi:protein O-GlcNAc transferase